MGGGEVLLHIVLQDLNSHVWIVNLDEQETFLYLKQWLYDQRCLGQIHNLQGPMYSQT